MKMNRFLRITEEKVTKKAAFFLDLEWTAGFKIAEDK